MGDRDLRFQQADGFPSTDDTITVMNRRDGAMQGGDFEMIKLTRLDGEPFVLNAELIRFVESRPDTFITLVGGERIMVLESMDEVVEAAIRYQQQKHFVPPPPRP